MLPFNLPHKVGAKFTVARTRGRVFPEGPRPILAVGASGFKPKIFRPVFPPKGETKGDDPFSQLGGGNPRPAVPPPAKVLGRQGKIRDFTEGDGPMGGLVFGWDAGAFWRGPSTPPRLLPEFYPGALNFGIRRRAGAVLRH